MHFVCFFLSWMTIIVNNVRSPYYTSRIKSTNTPTLLPSTLHSLLQLLHCTLPLEFTKNITRIFTSTLPLSVFPMNENNNDIISHLSSFDDFILEHEDGTRVSFPDDTKLTRTWPACFIHEKVKMSKLSIINFIDVGRTDLLEFIVKNSIQISSTRIRTSVLCTEVNTLIKLAKDWYCKYYTYLNYCLIFKKKLTPFAIQLF